MELDSLKDLQWRAKAFLVKQFGLDEDLRWVTARVGNQALDRFIAHPVRKEVAG
ncbi:MAG: hypothetical protein KGI38_10980 [Thaumarchaeota archaeon]|nr:hypothetical protein [Nitrososphaerota archaeon]